MERIFADGAEILFRNEKLKAVPQILTKSYI